MVPNMKDSSTVYVIQTSTKTMQKLHRNIVLPAANVALGWFSVNPACSVIYLFLYLFSIAISFTRNKTLPNHLIFSFGFSTSNTIHTVYNFLISTDIIKPVHLFKQTNEILHRQICSKSRVAWYILNTGL